MLVGHALTHSVQARVVAASLDDGVRRGRVQHLAGRFLQRRDVALDELVLEVEGGGGDDDALAVQEAGHQVAERLARAGARLDQQVGVRAERGLHRLGHLHLAGALSSLDRLHGSLQDLPDVGLIGALFLHKAGA